MLDGKEVKLLPVGWTSDAIALLARSGHMYIVSPDGLRNPTVIPSFQPFSQAEMRGELLREFGSTYEVSGTGNYLVVHPDGTRDVWARRFEDLHRSMIHFFRTRGFNLQRPKFPLVGIVFYSRSQYLEYTQTMFKFNASAATGYYMPTTNRVYLYDATRGTRNSSYARQENFATVMHETAHQTAFNTGIHVRSAATPRWVSEGLGCLFEAPGVYDSFHYKRRVDRINHGRLAKFQEAVKPTVREVIAASVTSDDPFKFDADRSYAAAWALTFYLSEREPTNYIRYLQTVAQHKPLEPYRADQRVREFTTVFGKDFRTVGARVTRFFDELPRP